MSTRIQTPLDDRGGLTLAEPVLLTSKKPEPFITLARRLWWVIALTSLIGGALGIGAALTLPAWYQSTATFAVLPVDDPTAPLQFDPTGTGPPLFTHVLTSHRVTGQVAEQAHLMDVYRTPTVEDARRELVGHIGVTLDRKANLVTLLVEDRNPARARAIAEALSEVARQTSAEIWSARSTEHRKRLEAQLADVTKSLAAAEDAMRVFREREQVVDLPEQIKASVAETAFLARLKNEKKMGLYFSQSFGGAESPEVRRNQLEAGGASAALQGLVQGGQRGPLLALNNLPRLEVEHARLKREIDTNTSRYETLVKQVDQVRAVEARPGGRVEVVDVPSDARNRVRPSRRALAVEGLAFGLLLGLLYVGWPRLRFSVDQFRPR